MSLAGMPGHARVWLYAASQPLNPDQENSLNILLKDFVSDWTAHGNSLLAGYEIRDHFLIVIAVDEKQSPPSGCSIDKSVRLLKEFQTAENLELFDRWLLPVKMESGWQVLSPEKIEAKISSGEINAQTPVKNMLVKTLEQYQNELKIPINTSWIKNKLAL